MRRLTGLPVHHIISVNFRGFPAVVDKLGGVEVDNPTPLSNCPYPGGRTVSFPGGTIDLDGDRALEYVRVRKCDDDFQRDRRQQAFLAGLKAKLVSPLSAWRAPWNGAAVVGTLSTDMGVNDLTKFAWLQWRLTQSPEDRYVLAGTPQNIGGVSYVILDPPRRPSSCAASPPADARPGSDLVEPHGLGGTARVRGRRGRGGRSAVAGPAAAGLSAPPPSPPRRPRAGAWCRSRCCGSRCP